MRDIVDGVEEYKYEPINVGNERNFHYSGTPVRQDFFYWTVNFHLKRFGKGENPPRWMLVVDWLLHYHFEILKRFWEA